MRVGKPFILLALILLVGGVQAASQPAQLRISLTIVDRCEIRASPAHPSQAHPSVDCSIGVPWTVAPATFATADMAPALVVDGTTTAQFPVPLGGSLDGARVTAIVF